ncbi:MAG: hypothetical protein ACPG5B_02070 [Chitinophagales bacterium]
MLSKQDTILIEKYFDDELTEAELQIFRQRKNDNLEFRKMVNTYKLTQLAFEHPLAKTLSIINELEDNSFLDETERGFVHAQGDSLDLSNNFEPNQAFERETFAPKAVATRSRNTTSLLSLQEQILLPLHEANFNTQIISFEFEEPIPYPIELQIIDRDSIPLMLSENQIPADVYSFEVTILDAKPGRYYWEMEVESDTRKYDQAFGIFFLRKDLMKPKK